MNFRWDNKKCLERISFSDAKEQPNMYRNGNMVMIEQNARKTVLQTSNIFDSKDLFISFIPLFIQIRFLPVY